MAEPTPTITRQQRLAWYQEARFGLIIHWGAYAVAGVEASWPIMAPDLSEAMYRTTTRIAEANYRALPGRFNPADFNADDWVRIARDAGMRYIVITAKHHDGFCMFDAPGTDYKITRTAFGRDVCKELAEACARANMPLGFYYSPPDMHHPGYRDTTKPSTQNWLGEPKRPQWAGYLDYMESHIRTLLTGYGDVCIIWFDGLANHAKFDPPRFHRLIHELSPSTLINDRLGDGYDYITPEQFIPTAGVPVRTGKPPSSNDAGSESFFRIVSALFKVPGLCGAIRTQIRKFADGQLELTPVLKEPYPSPERFQPWETCMTMGRTWAHNPHETAWKDAGTLVRNLVEVASRGGNYLLNVGPTATGVFPPQAIERLGVVGQWMSVHGDAIYGSTYTPLQTAPWGRATRKGDRLYLHVLNWPAGGTLTVDDLPATARSVSLMGGGALSFTQSGEQLNIALPAQAPAIDVPVLVVDVDGSAAGWTAYSPATSTVVAPRTYIKRQAVASAVINAVINGLIALATYRARSSIPFAEASVDIPITVAIIAFLVSWIAIGMARQELAKGNLGKAASSLKRIRLPGGAARRALVIAAVCVVVFGVVVLNGLLYLLSPGGLGNWAYIGFKTLYTGATAALAAVLAIGSVVTEE